MKLNETIIYQIYPLGLCGCPFPNDSVSESRILNVLNFVPHIKELGANCVLFNPLFESDNHGYDSRDFYKVDCRLGTNDDFKKVCDALHENGINVMLDGVFNHVGRGFWAFEDVKQKKWDSPYKDWFIINFDGNSAYNDGFWYEGWEGHFELVKLNLYNPQVKEYIFNAIRFWVNEFGIDGLRLDVAYSLNPDFLRELRYFANGVKDGFILIGETLHGDYNRWMNNDACHSVTNYECYKGLYSSFNCANMHEISYSLNRQFGPENWCLYTGKTLLNFVDNHDVTRIASILEDKKHLPVIYGMLIGMPGVPSIYCGSEWGLEGEKRNGDIALRPALQNPESNELTDYVKSLLKARSASEAIKYGSYKNILVQPKQLIFERRTNNERVLVAINSSAEEYDAHFNAECGTAVDLITGKKHDFGGGSKLSPYSCYYWKMEK